MTKKREKLSPNFYLDEFDCNDGTAVPRAYIPELRYLCETFLEPMRAKFGPCRVHSGFRTESWNRHVGGARESFHLYLIRKPSEGVASDVSFKRGSVTDWKKEAERIRRRRRSGKGGIGYYPAGGFVHVDSRDYAADWDGS